MEHATQGQVDSVRLASKVSGLDEEQILKTRDSEDGGMVVIDVTGKKRTYTSAQLAQALAREMNGRRNLGAQDPEPSEMYHRVSGYGGKRAGSGRKPKGEGKRQKNTDVILFEPPQEDADTL